MNSLRNYLVVSVFLIKCCFSHTVNSLDDLKHFLVKFDVSLGIASKIYDQRTQWFSNDKYKDTFFKIIPSAIDDCIAQRGVFAKENLRNDMVIFKGTEARQYTRANWNAVVFYNYIKKIYDNFRTDFDNLDTFYDELKESLYNLYKDNKKQIERACYEIRNYYANFLSIEKIKTYVNEYRRVDSKWIGYMTNAFIHQNSDKSIEACVLLNARYLNHVFNLGKETEFFLSIQNGNVSNLISQTVIKINKLFKDQKELENTEIFLYEYMKPVKTLKSSKIIIETDMKHTLYRSLLLIQNIYYNVKTPIIKFMLNDNVVLKYECNNLIKYFRSSNQKVDLFYIMRNELVYLMQQQKWINQDFAYETAISFINYLIRAYNGYNFIQTVKPLNETKATLEEIPYLPKEFIDKVNKSQHDSEEDSESEEVSDNESISSEDSCNKDKIFRKKKRQAELSESDDDYD